VPLPEPVDGKRLGVRVARQYTVAMIASVVGIALCLTCIGAPLGIFLICWSCKRIADTLNGAIEQHVDYSSLSSAVKLPINTAEPQD
jgi:Na+/H+ antiporter NhaA